MSVPSPLHAVDAGSSAGAADTSAVEARLSASEQRLQSALEGLGAAAFDWRPATDELYWSPGHYRLFGLGPASGPPCYALWRRHVHRDDVARVEEEVREARARGGRFATEYRIRRADGVERWIQSSCEVLHDAGGERMLGAVLDITDRKAVEERLRRNAASFRRLIQGNPFGVYIVDADFRLWQVSDGSQKVFANVRPLLGRDFAEVLRLIRPEPFASEAIAIFRHTLATGEPYRAPTTVEPRRDGATVEVYDWRIDRITLPDGRYGVVCHFYDLSERQAWEQQVQERERRFAVLANAVPQLVWANLPDGTNEFLNEAWYDYTGLTPEESRGSSGWSRALHPEDRDRVWAEWTAALENGTPYDIELRLRRHDGSYRWFLARAHPERDANGAIERWIGSCTDIEEKRTLVERLQRTAGLLRAATDAAHLGVHQWDVRSGRLDWDERLRRWWHVADDVPVTYDVFMNGIHPADRADVQAAVDRALDPAGPGRYDAEFRVAAGDGEPRWLRATGNVAFEDGSAQRLTGTVQDISAQKALEAELRDADRQKDAFLATLSHELRNPLAPIRTATQILATPALDAAQLAWAREVIQRQLSNMARLLDDLLDLARVTKGKIVLRKERVSLRDVVDGAIETARPLLESREHRLLVDLPTSPVELEADPLRLAQVLSNLLTNAAKYTDPGGSVVVAASVVGDTLRLSVRDNGIGIAADAMPRLFSMFAQVENPARAQGGLGIGLALVKGFVELHGGRVEAHSEGPGCGAEFVVSLPCVPAGPVPVLAPSATREARGQGLRILVADDNKDAADALAMFLELRGHVVAVAYGGRRALALAETFAADLAFLDIGMPDVDGYRVARTLRGTAHGATLPLVAITGWGQEEDKRRARDAGFDLHLTKPVSPADLERLLKERLALRRS
jgi:PAS domain S-box-containing protein